MAKIKEKEKAIKLRRKGLSYREILEEISVSKSTLSLWLRSVGLSKKQKQRLTEKKLAAAKRGWEACRQKRILITKQIKNKARGEIGKINKKELWLIGVALYWAEGDKERNGSCLVGLGNSDPYLIQVFLKWLREICEISDDDIFFRIFLHDNNKRRLKEVKKYWSQITGFPITEFDRITWKKNKIKTKRKNIGKNYYGLLKVFVRKSSNFNRRIEGWKEGIYNAG